MARLIFLFFVALAGFWFGFVSPNRKAQSPEMRYQADRDFPLREHKSFVIALYGCNQELWCQRALRSVFEQDYDNYRVIFIDDASSDQTEEKAKTFITENQQESKVLFLKNEARIGFIASLYRAIDQCLDREIVIPMEAKNWLSHPHALSRLNAAYQNPEVWLTLAEGLDYPSYETSREPFFSFYSALFREIHIADLFDERGKFAEEGTLCFNYLAQLAGGRICQLSDPLAFYNRVAVSRQKGGASAAKTAYAPLKAFPEPKEVKEIDLVIVSTDQPERLFSCLESIQSHCSGFDRLSVLYRVTDPAHLFHYERVERSFPAFSFIPFSEKNFREKLSDLVAHSDYVWVSDDQAVCCAEIDLKICAQRLRQTGAHGFLLQKGEALLGKALFGSVSACYKEGAPLRQMLVPAQSVHEALSSKKIKEYQNLELAWEEKTPPHEREVELYLNY